MGEALAADPSPALAELRERGPVAWHPIYRRWLISDRREVWKVVIDFRRFTVEGTSVETLFGADAFIAMADRGRHHPLRDVWADAFREPGVAAGDRGDGRRLGRPRRGAPARWRGGRRQRGFVPPPADARDGRSRRDARRRRARRHHCGRRVRDLHPRRGQPRSDSLGRSRPFRYPRPPQPSLGFGIGFHNCLGLVLAKMEADRAAAALLEAVPDDAIAFLLGLPLDCPQCQIFSGRYPRRLEPTIAGDGRVMYDWTPPSGASDVVNDDRVKMDLQFSTQWDGLSHYGACFDADETVSPNTSFTTATAPIAMSRSRAPGSRRTRVRWGSRLWRGCAWRRDGVARQDRYEALMRAIQAQDAAV